MSDAADMILINPNASFDEATEHHSNWPPPGGASVKVLMDGDEAETATERCLWPRCFKMLRHRLDKPPQSQKTKTLAQREQFLWQLYHFRDGSEYPMRWMFWRCPLETPAVRGTTGARYDGELEERDFTHYGDGVPTDSLEGIRRSKENAKEIARRLRGNKKPSMAIREGRLRKERDKIRRVLGREDTGLSDAELAKYRERADGIDREIRSMRKPVRAWDWLHGCPAEETPQDSVPF